MKLRKSLQILNEKTYELDVPKRDVIERLMQQQGLLHRNGCRKGLKTLDLAFTCDKNGFFKIYEDLDYMAKSLLRTYYVCGEILEENGKTKVKVYTVRDRVSIICKNSLPFVHLALIGAWFTLAYILGIHFVVPLLFTLSNIYTLILDAYNFKKEFAQKDNDIKAMHEAVNKRIEAAKHWDD